VQRGIVPGGGPRADAAGILAGTDPPAGTPATGPAYRE